MKSINIQIIKISYPTLTNSEYISLSKQIEFLNGKDTLNGQNVELLSYDKLHIDFSISWAEQRTFKGIVTGDNVEEIILDIHRKAICRFRFQDNTLLSNGLNRQYSKMLQIIWPNHSLRPAYSEFKFNLKELINNSLIENFIKPTLSDLLIDDLPVESIPAATLHIKQCNLSELRNLIFGTNATIRRFSCVPKNKEFDLVTISGRGGVKVSGEFLDWEQPVNFAELLLENINLLGE
ncbi:MAG: hypothetical protein KKA54_10750 [Proteobacteria bacterium]|nr:hypothetical protein [Pseudomonadota bacterium]